VVLEADDLAEVRVEDDAADHPGGVPTGGHVEDPQPGQLSLLDRDEGVAEELVHPADHDHGHTGGRPAPEPVGDEREIVLDPRLSGVLPAAAEEEVGLVRQVRAGVVVVDRHVISMASDPGGETPRVAQVAVDRHLPGIEVHERDQALARHAGSSPKFARW